MGFECGFDTVKRFYDLSPREYLITKDYLEYKNNSWAQEHYFTFEDYYVSINNGKKPYDIPNENVVNFYQENKEENIDFWCSIGRHLDDFIRPNLEEIDIGTERYLVTEEFLEKAEDWVNDELNSNELIEAIPVKGIKMLKDEEILSPIDGVVLEDEEGNIHNIYSEYDSVFISRNKYFDYSYYKALQSFKDCINKMKTIDLDENWIFYYRSY